MTGTENICLGGDIGMRQRQFPKLGLMGPFGGKPLMANSQAK